VRAWADPSIAALIALRGGYGSAELLPLLHHLRPAQSPKLFIGYSDTTALLTWLTCVVRRAGAARTDDRGQAAKGAEGYDERSFLERASAASGTALQPPGL
jgi:muramoyltetrapeptide carboxypeptidase